MVLRHPLPAGGQGTGSLLSPHPPSTRSPPFLPPSPPLSSPSPSPLKRAGSALAPCSRRTVRAGGAVSSSCTQRPARQSRKPVEQSAQSGTGSGDPGSPGNPGGPNSLKGSLRDSNCSADCELWRQSPATAVAVSVGLAEAFSLFYLPPHFYSSGLDNKVSIRSGCQNRVRRVKRESRTYCAEASGCLLLGSFD